jgi:hypothetical protein
MKALFLILLVFLIQLEISGNMQVGTPAADTTTTTTISAAENDSGSGISVVLITLFIILLASLAMKKK